MGFTVLLFLLRSLVSMNFNVVYIYTAEVGPSSGAILASRSRCERRVSGPQVYPTVARSLGMGFCTSFSRIGGMIAPFIAQVSSPGRCLRASPSLTVLCVSRRC